MDDGVALSEHQPIERAGLTPALAFEGKQAAAADEEELFAWTTLRHRAVIVALAKQAPPNRRRRHDAGIEIERRRIGRGLPGGARRIEQFASLEARGELADAYGQPRQRAIFEQIGETLRRFIMRRKVDALGRNQSLACGDRSGCAEDRVADDE